MEQSLLALLAAVFVFATVCLLAVVVLWRGDDRVQARAALLRPRARDHDLPDLARPFTERVLIPALDGLAKRLVAILPQSLLTGVRRKLVLAGEPLNLQGFLMVSGVSGGLLLALGFSMVVAMGGGFHAKQLLMLAALTIAGVVFPYFWLVGRVRGRQAIITKSLPDAFDLVTTCVEAGLGLDAALARVAEKVEGPFAEELGRSLSDIGMGRMRRDALRDLADRTGVPDLVMFVNAVIQAEQMGTSIGQVLRVQSDQLRLRRRQRAEEQAHQAPVKMTFPLVLFVLPTCFWSFWARLELPCMTPS
jgi:tight adherence protein C